MELASVSIVNFRCFGSSETTVKFQKGLNVVVGENNSGKSTILRAIERVIAPDYPFEDADHYRGLRRVRITIVLKAVLDIRELEGLLTHLLGEQTKITADEAKALQEMTIQRSSDGGYTVKFGVLHFHSGTPNAGFISSELAAKGGYQVVDGAEPLRAALADSSKTWTQIFATYADPNKIALDFRDSPFSFLGSQIYPKIRNFAEIRSRPEGRGEHVPESFDGSRVADVLDGLKNGRLKERAKWEKIRLQFQRMFPLLEVDVTRPQGIPRIVVVEKGSRFEAPVEAVGAGIGQTIILIAHLVAKEGMVFGVDIPESHFHPHAQRLLLATMEDFSARNQIVIVTHSPIFVPARALDRVTFVRRSDAGAKIKQLDPAYFSDNERGKLERHLNLWGKDIFFSKVVLAVEGETEVGAFPVFAENMGMNFEKLGVTVAHLGGKDFSYLAKMLRGFSLPYLVVTDIDAIENIESSIKIPEELHTSAVIYQLYELGQLSNRDVQLLRQATIVGEGESRHYDRNGIGQLIGIARKHHITVLSATFEELVQQYLPEQTIRHCEKVSRSKVVRGMLMAEEAVKLDKIPTEFQNVVRQIAKKAHAS